MKEYLKKSLATNVPMTVTMKKRGKAYDEKKFGTDELTGKKEYHYVFTTSGRELEHYAKEYEQEALQHYREGETLQVVRVEKVGNDGKRFAIIQWGTPGSAEMTAAPQVHSTSKTVAQERKQDDYEKAAQEKEYRISLAGLVQAYITQGVPDEQVIEKAKNMRVLIAQEASKLANSQI